MSLLTYRPQPGQIEEYLSHLSSHQREVYDRITSIVEDNVDWNVGRGPWVVGEYENDICGPGPGPGPGPGSGSRSDSGSSNMKRKGKITYLLSDAMAAKDRDLIMRKLNINAIVNCAPKVVKTGAEYYHYDEEDGSGDEGEGRKRGSGVHYLSVDATDTWDYEILKIHFDEVRAFIDGIRHSCSACPSASTPVSPPEQEQQQELKILVHCFQGTNRSAALLIAYVMVTHKLPLLALVKQLQQARGAVLYNFGFRVQLVQLASELQLLD